MRGEEIGGEGGIRTHGTLARTTVFETVPIDHSGTSPRTGRDGGRRVVERRLNSRGGGRAQEPETNCRSSVHGRRAEATDQRRVAELHSHASAAPAMPAARMSATGWLPAWRVNSFMPRP